MTRSASIKTNQQIPTDIEVFQNRLGSDALITKLMSQLVEGVRLPGKVGRKRGSVNCVDSNQLVALANHLLDAILKPFKLAGGRAPMPLSTPASADAEVDIDAQMATIDASSRADRRNLRKDCLRRDSYRCVYSGKWDTASVYEGIVVPSPEHGVYACVLATGWD
ncbi:hypothetical protein F503_01648 [Ophiostoma piceae UAMH 11346]|uniref:Uncharacterized protein n=1 Tax=Ophiostoma piceae (strain UAMH 11346) TaxID=1262450 RepID=S3BR50_OPHP1|nr:hypothetical protein F503_01648 [Ophiostoma piceae UAMH 11346]